MNGEKADMVFTDPPYGIEVVSKGIGYLGKCPYVDVVQLITVPTTLKKIEEAKPTNA